VPAFAVLAALTLGGLGLALGLVSRRTV
jgi:hypothetical protein